MPDQRFLCIHGHFYQPPRENPWLEAIELQDSAYPHHDWNERITDECYRRNAASRILDGEGRIVNIVNNYARMSFNFGPTVLSWMQEHAPDVHQAIVDADRLSQERFSGHGSAMAQAYGHMILPLSNERDRRTQVIWGKRDFEHRFGRAPEGMWLPETAANVASLEALAEQEITFTVLAPRQARRTRPLRGGRWREVDESVDPSRAYQVRLPSGRSIAVFFYDGPISQAVAFEGLLNSGERFAHRLLSGFDGERGAGPQLVHIATDGETYGHHHAHGEMALADALERIEENPDVTLTNYGEFLESHPPGHLAEIHDASSWSCVHGVGRWMTDCGCNTGGRSGWNQQWRGPLREALDWLRDALAPRYERAAGELVHDPWAMRDDYISVLLDRSPENVEAFFARHARGPLDEGAKIRLLQLLELQRHAMLMYTSCGWFFDELSGIETVQVIQYAGRAIQLAEELFGERIEDPFLERLEAARSNLAEHGNGRQIYQKFVKPTVVDLAKVGAHFAASSLFEEYGEQTRIYCYQAELHDLQRRSAGRARLHVGRARFVSDITWESAELAFAMLHLGDHVINGGVRRFEGEERYAQLVRETVEAFDRADFTALLRMMDSVLGSNYSLSSLFRDEQRKVVNQILESSLSHVESSYRALYEQYAPLVRFLSGLHIPVPKALDIPAHFVINASFREALEADPPDVARMRELLAEAASQSVQLDQVTLAFAADHALDGAAERLRAEPRDAQLVEQAAALVGLVRELPFRTPLADLQNAYWGLGQTLRPEQAAAAEAGDESARQWLALFDDLGEKLRVRVNGRVAAVVG